MRQEPGSHLTEQIISISIKAHRALGPGLPESVCRARGSAAAGLSRPSSGKELHGGHDRRVDCPDRIQDGRTHSPAPRSLTRTYLRLCNCQIAPLMKFNTPMLKDRLRRFIP
jgi:hypothetical protein